jgi:predicted Zn-dependent peptidase
LSPPESGSLANGLPVFRIPIEGTRAATLLIAFDAGSRSEPAGQDGIAHFLEHLVFQGGGDYPDVRTINWAAERLGARMNALTSAEFVAFHITVRAEHLLEGADLLTDFLSQPRLDAAELERERGVVIQEIARAHDQPSALADELIDRAAYGDHPLGRSVLGTEASVTSLTRENVLAFKEGRWAGEDGGAFLVGNLGGLVEGQVERLLERLPAVGRVPRPATSPPRRSGVIVEPRESKQSHLRLGYRPAIDMSDPAARAALTIYTTLLGGSMGSRLVDEIRERRGLAYSVGAMDYTASDAALVQLSAGLDSARCVEACRRMRELVDELGSEGPGEDEVERVRSYASGRRVLAFESTSAVARNAAEQRVVFGDDVDPDAAIVRLDEVGCDEVAEVARLVGGEPAVACVGPHRVEEFT